MVYGQRNESITMSNQGRISPPEIWTAERIIELIKLGNLPPWAKSWSTSPEHAPHNLLNPKSQYRGLNYLLLSMVADMMGSPFFITPKQLFELGGKKKDDEQHTWPVFFFTKKVYKNKNKSDEDEEDNHEVFICKGYKVYNIKQTIGIPEDKIPVLPTPETFEHTPIEICEQIVARYIGPDTVHQGQKACYVPVEDRIYIPERERFIIPDKYYATRFHEMAHSTGHKSRLNRAAIQHVNFGSHKYSQEELVAEFCSAMLCGKAGISQNTIENSAAYIKGWSSKLKPEMLVLGSREARKAYEFITGEYSVNSSRSED
jgi:antirestriction protein ArdC